MWFLEICHGGLWGAPRAEGRERQPGAAAHPEHTYCDW